MDFLGQQVRGPAESGELSTSGLALRPFLLRLLAWAVPVIVVWMLITPFYNRFLKVSAENLLNLSESPDVTELYFHPEKEYRDRGYVVVHRSDFPPSRRQVYSFRATDLHFHLLLLGSLFLAVPAIPWRERLEKLGWALLLSVFFHILLAFFWVKFGYATQLGSWSLENYGAFARNFYGLGKHLLDLPFKLAFPFVLWVVFYFPLLIPRQS
ncbi:MAG: hypothetical protein AAF604_15930 [Acidobacteriota bacterium]